MSNFVKCYDLGIIGGGIIGLATARQALLSHPHLKVALFEKDSILANHSSHRNSGVVHRGIYYKKGSTKSLACIEGAKLIEEYCKKNNLDYRECGKLIVATRDFELDRLIKLFDNAKAAGVEHIELIDKDKIIDIQPGCDMALKAIWSPKTAIVDWQKVAQSFADDFNNLGGVIHKNFLVPKIELGDKDYKLKNHISPDQIVRCKSLVCCAGMFSEMLAIRTGNSKYPLVVPFKGKYHFLSDRLKGKIRTNIYPVPDPKLPFLGVHITPRLDDSVLVGPTSLLNFGYENYSDHDRMSFLLMMKILSDKSVRKLLFDRNNLRAGLKELWRHTSIFRLAAEVRKLFPEVEADDLIDLDFSGIRAQTISQNGLIVDDYIFESGLKPGYGKVLHVRNCPSPAATSSLSIARRILTHLETSYIN